MPLDLTDVALFVRVAATQNLSAAGREFSLSPAASSTRISQLEKQLNARLLIRSTRKVSLSQEGELFLPAAQALLEAADAAQATLTGVGAGAQGLLRVAVSAAFGRQHLSPLLPAFLQRYPKIRLDLRLSDQVADIAAEGIDVAIRIGALKDSSLVARKLAPNRQVFCASPAYLARHGTPSTPQELSRHQCLVLGGRRDWKFRHRQQKNELPNVRVSGILESDNYEILSDAALAGLGVQLKATWDAAPHLRSGNLLQILPDYELLEDSFIWALYPSRKFLPPKTQVFVAFLAEHFGPEPYWDKGLDGNF